MPNKAWDNTTRGFRWMILLLVALSPLFVWIIQDYQVSLYGVIGLTFFVLASIFSLVCSLLLLAAGIDLYRFREKKQRSHNDYKKTNWRSKATNEST